MIGVIIYYLHMKIYQELRVIISLFPCSIPSKIPVTSLVTSLGTQGSVRYSYCSVLVENDGFSLHECK